MALPISDAPAFDPATYPIRVYVSRRHVYVGSTQQPVVTIPAPDAAHGQGFGTPNKHGPNDLLVLPLQAAVRPLSPESKRGAAIYADASMSYRILTELLFTLSVSGCDNWVLVTAGSSPGSDRGWQTRVPSKLGHTRVSLFVVRDGYAIRVDGQDYGGGCTPGGKGITVPLSNGRHDEEVLEACLRGVAETAPVAVAANPDQPYQDVIDAVGVTARVGFTAPAFKVPWSE